MISQEEISETVKTQLAQLDKLQGKVTIVLSDQTTSLADAYKLVKDQIVRDRILKLLSNTSVRNDYICAFKEEGLYSEENIEIIQAILIYRVSRALVTSGDYHVYRGLLNHLGMDMKKMCLATINFLHDKNFLDDEYAENWISTLLEDIRFLG